MLPTNHTSITQSFQQSRIYNYLSADSPGYKHSTTIVGEASGFMTEAFTMGIGTNGPVDPRAAIQENVMHNLFIPRCYYWLILQIQTDVKGIDSDV